MNKTHASNYFVHFAHYMKGGTSSCSHICVKHSNWSNLRWTLKLIKSLMNTQINQLFNCLSLWSLKFKSFNRVERNYRIKSSLFAHSYTVLSFFYIYCWAIEIEICLKFLFKRDLELKFWFGTPTFDFLKRAYWYFCLWCDYVIEDYVIEGLTTIIENNLNMEVKPLHKLFHLSLIICSLAFMKQLKIKVGHSRLRFKILHKCILLECINNYFF